MTDANRMIGRSRCGLEAAPYVLGALEPDEARAFVRHLQRCAVCRDEVAALAPVRDALAAAAPPLRVPPALRRRVLRVAREEPRASLRPRRRRLHTALVPASLATATAIAAAIIVLLGGGQPRARVIPASVGQAELRVTDRGGELIVEHLAPLPPNRTYELWLQVGGRTPAPSTLFAVSTGGSADVSVPGDLRGISRVLVTVEPSGGSFVPTNRPVIQVPLSYVRPS